MFDFERWCSWVEAQGKQTAVKHMTIDFHRGRPSPKRGATVDFKTDRKLLSFEFWETGEADFHGLDLRTREPVVYFFGRLLDNDSFEHTFRECLSAAAER